MKEYRNLFLSVVVFFLILFAGAGIYHIVEGWSKLDSIYFASMTVTTVGYGDFVPVTTAGKVFTIFFSFFGIVFVFYLISVMGGILFKRHVSKHLKRLGDN